MMATRAVSCVAGVPTAAPARHTRSVAVAHGLRQRDTQQMGRGVVTARRIAHRKRAGLRVEAMGNPTGKLSELKNCVEAQQFNREMLDELFDIARKCESVKPGTPESKELEGYIMSTLFYEPSTRTRLSFESAMRKMGGSVLTTESAGEFSSAAKGETLEDSMRVIEGYADIIVLRHFNAGSAKKAAAAIDAPLINAGDGPGQHPTQALLDAYTIQRELGRLDNVRVGMVGDLANGRTVRSLTYLLAKNYNDVEFVFVAPPVVKMGDDVKEFLDRTGVKWTEVYDLKEVAADVDVLYQTRIQQERFKDRPEEYEQARGKYIIDQSIMDVMRKDSIVMHPLPRLDEITEEVDADPRAAYFRQAKNGLFVRMALVKVLLGKY
uniref:aspartate carbamoyltransferase n=1 Tax=Pyramimonas obovata TaxID=1411642 RepID=A0A7S0RLQ6_9CHLO|mmetsp:Transcript_37205/g.80998  ORF Transcript_37205/g.80998 Transcript_37205/m.80998 type:complete len:380 (+) Transcript_37205:176-1315(+)|eukprot:CAMPEP_0118935820 /NCGR_PEP_ID=MMETSP1169-20130426/15849_1 /TAXON_ID=36882 /ORGANISM="Pyramimonas obovata, Strain CCMP722" /LENGTH=379 /DNA_ID=CAMNT_0006878883 /DNA_START=157 /DNA_END=1296 /DNA_ORIENTATION=+